MQVVLDLFYKYDESIFRYNVAKNVIGGSWIYLLYEHAVKEGFEVILASDYLRKGKYSSEDLIISDSITANTKKLLSTPAKPFILFSGESPNVDWKLYTFINKYSSSYKYTMLFSGCKSYIHSNSQFIPFFWPNDARAAQALCLGSTKKESQSIVMIASNKKQHSISDGNLLKKGVKGVLMKILTNTLPSIKLRDLYSFRMEALKYFSHRSYFRLYGKNWHNYNNLNKSERDAVIRLAPKEIDDKIELLRRYEFALCFENCVYPGYITEKIFDCFFAKCIPVYLGAPDVEKYIPSDLFIDMRSFPDFKSLDEYIKNLSLEKKLGYQNRIETYLKSESFKSFTDVNFSHNILRIILKESKTALH